jgi:biotin carboxylase
VKKRLIITSVGSLVGQNVLDTLHGRREHVLIIGTNSIVEAANNFRCDKAYLVPPAACTADYVAALCSLIANERPDLVIPGRDDDIVILADLKAQLPAYSESLLVGSGHFARVMDDKVKSYAFARQYELPFSPTLLSAGAGIESDLQQMVEVFGFPLIAKPVAGNGSRGVWIVTNEQQLGQVSREPGYAIQPLLGDKPDLTMDTRFGLPFVWQVPEDNLFAAQVLIDRQGKIFDMIGFVSRMVAGRCEQLRRCIDPGLLRITRRFAEAAVEEGWRGPFNLQLKRDPTHGFQAIEMNGRFSGGTSARYYLGFDEVGKIVNLWTDSQSVADSSRPQGTDLVTKILTDFPIRNADMEQMSANFVWERLAHT